MQQRRDPCLPADLLVRHPRQLGNAGDDLPSGLAEQIEGVLIPPGPLERARVDRQPPCRIELAQLAARDQRHERCVCVAAFVGAEKGPVPTTDRFAAARSSFCESIAARPRGSGRRRRRARRSATEAIWSGSPRSCSFLDRVPLGDQLASRSCAASFQAQKDNVARLIRLRAANLRAVSPLGRQHLAPPMATRRWCSTVAATTGQVEAPTARAR
jgi:hypothetical protein